MKVIKHNIYLTPTVKTVAFRVERGFNLSGDGEDDTFESVSENEAQPTDENSNLDYGGYFF